MDREQREDYLAGRALGEQMKAARESKAAQPRLDEARLQEIERRLDAQHAPRVSEVRALVAALRVERAERDRAVEALRYIKECDYGAKPFLGADGESIVKVINRVLAEQEKEQP